MSTQDRTHTKSSDTYGIVGCSNCGSHWIVERYGATSVTGPVTERDTFNEESHHSREAGTKGETPSRENTAERTGDARPRQPAGTVDATAGGVERLSLSFFVLLYRVLSSCVVWKKEKTHGPVTTLSTAFGGGR